MSNIRQIIIEIIESKNSGIFPVENPEKIADEIIRVFNLDPLAYHFIPPNVEEVTDYIVEQGLLDQKTIPQIKKTAESFVNYYDAVGWSVGKAKKQMKSWKKALTNWCNRDWNQQESAKVDESIQAHILIQKQIKNHE